MERESVTIGRRIRQAREKAKISQGEFAVSLGVRPSTVSQWETGVRHPRRKLAEVARLLGVPVSYLYGTDAEVEEDEPVIREFRKLPPESRVLALDFIRFLLGRDEALGKSEGFGLSPAFSQNSLVSRSNLALA